MFPLSAYVISLSLFGFAHVYYELLYIRKNLVETIPKRFIIAVIVLLTILVFVKLIAFFVSFNNSLLFEIITLILLFTISLYYQTTVGNMLLVLIFSVAIIYKPILLLICLAFLHNLTPWGFLRLQGDAKNAWIIFLLNPCIVFILSLFFAMDSGYYSNNNAIQYLSHYVLMPRVEPMTIAFFSMAVYLQLIHYYCVLRILPGYSNAPIKLSKVMMVLLMLIIVGFICNFQVTKQFYGMIATFHAYLEIPLLLFLLPWKKRV